MKKPPVARTSSRSTPKKAAIDPIRAEVVARFLLATAEEMAGRQRDIAATMQAHLPAANVFVIDEIIEEMARDKTEKELAMLGVGQFFGELAVLGGHVIYENPHLSFVTYDDEHHRVAFLDFGPLTPRERAAGGELRVKPTDQPGLHHVAFTSGSMGDLVDSYVRLKEQGIVADYMRIKAFPFCDDVQEFLVKHPVTFVVEQNRDAQLRALLAIETGVARDRMTAVLDYGGEPLTSRAVVSAVVKHLEGATV